tara:strand:- start:1327 stop:2019 length:693 start_codon:yes stop_codon:yes gene_type:complete
MDAIYQCYRNNDKVEFVLDNFFKNGGDKVYLCSDQGNDFGYLYDRYPDRIIYKRNDEKSWSGKDGFESKSKALYWLTWFTEACRRLTSDHFILLEDDIELRGDINTIPIQYEIMGPPKNIHNTFGQSIQDYMYDIDQQNIPMTFYAGCGGTIMNRKVIATGEFVYILNNHYEWMTAIEQKAKYSDAILTILFRLSGYESGENKEYTEPFVNDNWASSSHKILHYKKYYTC